jgi:hypothetical protein
MFTADFINKISPFSTLRFMDTLNVTNDTSIQNWSQRTWPSSGSRFQAGGMAYEDIIAFANQTGKAIWINIPVAATDDYVCRLARLLRYGEPSDKSNSACSTTAAGNGTETPLNPNITVYVELSNEIWNSSFEEWNQLYCWANGAAPSGHDCPAGPTPTSAMGRAALASSFFINWNSSQNDPYGKGLLYGIFLTKRNHDIFAQVFGSQAGQVKIVYNAQAWGSGSYSYYFPFFQAAYGAIGSYIPVYAFAPYLSLSNSADISSTNTIFSDLNAVLADTSSNGLGAILSSNIAVAQQFGMTPAAYEGGQSLTGNTTTVCQAQSDARMKSLYQSYFNLWAQKAGASTLFNHYSFVGDCGSYGQWGALVLQSDNCSQKWSALMSLTGGPACTP